jgi:5-methylcytosine-specific restriction endonuclease McrBC regulatory subunit McrC
MRTVHLRESSWTEVHLTTSEVDRLSAAGKALALQSSAQDALGDELLEPDRSLIRLRKAPARESWQVYVADAIGAVGLGETQLVVSPKIPMDHFCHLALASVVDMRSGLGTAQLTTDPSDSFQLVVARWYLQALEGCLRGAAFHDYEDHEASLATPRGRLDALATVDSWSRGKLHFDCAFSDFTADNGVNRVLVQAARAITRSTIDQALRRRAALALDRFPEMSPFRQADMGSRLDRSTKYEGAFRLALLVLSGFGATLSTGSQEVGTFLLRTPSLVESGLRRMLATGLADMAKVSMARKVLAPIGLSMNPDLLFQDRSSERPSFVVNGGLVTGDIKYQVTNRDWKRSHLYQAIAFASAFEAASGMILAFTTDAYSPAQKVIVGRRPYWLITWSVSEESTPWESEQRAVDECRVILKDVLTKVA